jgi:DNA-binding XRE family transcriptional regulator
MEQRRVKQRPRLNLAGPRIQQIRNQQGLSQEMLSARCEAKGIILSRSTLAKIETQVRCLTDIELVMIARALRVKLKDIFFDR